MKEATEPKDRDKRIELVHVVFGVPRENCRRYGICQIEKRAEIPPQYIAKNKACFAELTITQDAATFVFFTHTMTRHTEGKYFSTDSFLIEAPKPTEWGILLRGGYPIKKTADNYLVTVDLVPTDPQVLQRPPQVNTRQKCCLTT